MKFCFIISILFTSIYIAKSQSAEVIAEVKKNDLKVVKQKGKYGLKNTSIILMPAIYDSVTLAVFNVELINDKNLLEKKTGTNSYLYFWQNGLFSVCQLPKGNLLVAGVQQFVPCKRIGAAKDIYKANSKWGFVGYNAVYDSIRVLLTDSIELDVEAYKAADGILDVKAYSSYAKYVTGYYECKKGNCLYLIDDNFTINDIQKAASVCSTGYFIRSPLLVFTNTSNPLHYTYQLVTERKLTVPYDTIVYLSKQDRIAGVNKQDGTVEVYTPGGHKINTILFTGIASLAEQMDEQLNTEKAAALKKEEDKKRLEEQEKQNRITVSNKNYKWLKTVEVTRGNNTQYMGLCTGSGQVMLPDCANDIHFVNTRFATGNQDLICRKLDNEPTECLPAHVPLVAALHYTEAMKQMPEMFYSPAIFANVPLYYTNKTGTGVSYYNLRIEMDFDYKQHRILDFKCPLCQGEGQIFEKKVTVIDTTINTHLVKTGETVITKKSYSSNERVRSDGSTYVPTYNTRLDNYGYKTDTVITKHTYDSYRKCPLCKGKAGQFSTTIEWAPDLRGFTIRKEPEYQPFRFKY